jgi:hypothetical protein
VATPTFLSTDQESVRASVLEALATDMRLRRVCARLAFVEVGDANGKWPRSTHNFKRAPRGPSQHVSKESFGF